MHTKPCGLVDIEGYFDHLIAFLDHSVRERFFRPEHRAMMLLEADPAALLDRFDRYRPPGLEKWTGRGSS